MAERADEYQNQTWNKSEPFWEQELRVEILLRARDSRFIFLSFCTLNFSVSLKYRSHFEKSSSQKKVLLIDNFHRRILSCT